MSQVYNLPKIYRYIYVYYYLITMYIDLKKIPLSHAYNYILNRSEIHAHWVECNSFNDQYLVCIFRTAKTAI